MDLSGPRRPLHLRMINFFRARAEADVGLDGIVQEEDLLRNVASMRLPAAVPLWRETHSVDDHRSGRRLEQPEQDVNQVALAPAGWSDDGDPLASGHHHRHLLEDGLR